MQILGIADHSVGGLESSLGHEYLLTDSDHLVSVSSHQQPHPGSHQPPPSSHQPSPVSGGRPGPSGPTLNGPASTFVGSATGFGIDLIWDNSVRMSANWSAIEAAVIAAAEIYTQAFSTSTEVEINIAVGYGEIDGSAMSSNALGESESYGYITNYSTVASALTTADSDLVSNGLMSSNAIAADASSLSNANFFVTSAEAKALGLVAGTSSGIDGYIGLTSSPSLLYFGSGAIGASQYDAVGVAAHEIGEVMGRIGLEGTNLGSYSDVYSPLDLFRYTSPGEADLTPTSGYFSTTDGSGGATTSNLYNNPQNGGDAADWASASGGVADGVANNNAYDAFGTPGVAMVVSSTDLLEEAALGFTLSAAGLADVRNNTSITA